jgi:hypothetical protein
MIFMYIKDDLGNLIGIYERPSFSRLEKLSEFAYKDIETGQDVYEEVYMLKMYFPGGTVVVKSKKEETLVDIEKAISGPWDGQYHAETAYCVSLGKDLAGNLNLL